MEPVRTKRCVVLAMVFALTLGITPGCKPRQGEKPAAAAKPSAQVEELLPQAEGGEPRQAVKDSPEVGLRKETLPPTPESATIEPAGAKSDISDGDTAGDSPGATSGAGAAVDSAGAAPAGDEADDDFPREDTPRETAKRLGAPLVEQPEKLQQLDKEAPIWLDKPGGRLIMVGEVCQQQAPLEMFVCIWGTKEHESVLTVRVPAKAAHAGLLALGAKVGNPVQFMPEYIPAGGSVIDIDVIWKDANGKIQKKRGQEWIRNYHTKKPMQLEWVFAGSGFWTDESSGKTYYQAEGGDFICVSNFSTAMLDLPVKSTNREKGLMFEALTEAIPPLGTPVTIVLKPRLDKSQK